MKKKSVFALIILLVALSLTGCGKNEAEIADPVTVVIPEKSQEEEVEKTELVYYGKVNTQNTGVNVRSTPSNDGIVIGTAEIGETLKVLEVGEWCKVEFKDGEGYIYGELLDITEGEPEAEEEEIQESDSDSSVGNDVITRVVNTND